MHGGRMGGHPKDNVRRWGRDHTLARGDQACAYPDAILKNFTNLEFEFYVLKILADFFNYSRSVDCLFIIIILSIL